MAEEKMTKQATAIDRKNGILLVAKDRKSVETMHGWTGRELGRQAALASQFTGLSLGYCMKMVLYRAAERIKA